MTVKDKTQARKVYSYFPNVPTTQVTAVAAVNIAAIEFKNIEFGGYSNVSRAKYGATPVTSAAGDFTGGQSFFYDDFAVASGKSITGVRLWWPGDLGSLQIKCRLCREAGATLIDTVSFDVNAAGIYYATFSTPFLMSETYAYDKFLVSMYETTGTWNVYVEYAAGATAGYTPHQGGVVLYPTRGIYYVESIYLAGDNNPISPTNDMYLVEPVFG